MKTCGIKTKQMEKPETLELAKILCKRLRTYNERMLHSMYDERNHYLEQDY